MGALSELPLSEDMQARWMSRHLVRDLADPNIAFTSWFHLSWFEHFTHTRTYHYGVLREKDFSHKPSFDVLKRIRQFFDDGCCVPDASLSLVLGISTKMPENLQTIVSGAAVYPFRRNGLPLFAVTSSWPAHEAMEPVKVGATLFTGETSGIWKDPVLLDLLDGKVKRLQPSAEGRCVHFELANHVKVVTEAAALAPHVKLPPRRKPVVAAPQHPGQVNHE